MVALPFGVAPNRVLKRVDSWSWPASIIPPHIFFIFSPHPSLVVITPFFSSSQEMISVLVRPNASAAERLWALRDLQGLVEPIDTADGGSMRRGWGQ